MGLDAEIGTDEVGVEIEREVREVKTLALDFGEARRVVGPAEVKWRAIEGLEFQVTQTVECQYAGDATDGEEERAADAGARFTTIEEQSDAGEKGEREQTCRGAGVERRATR